MSQACPAPASVSNFDDLAACLGVSRKSLLRWRAKYGRKCPQSKGESHDVAAWRQFIDRHGLGRPERVHTAALAAPPSPEAKEAAPSPSPSSAESLTHWKVRREELACTKMEREIAITDGGLLVATELEVAAGQLLAGICCALNQLPGSAARFLVGLRDVHVIQLKLEDEVASILQNLSAARYLTECVGEVVGTLPLDSVPASPAELRQFVEGLTREAFRRVGQLALAQITLPPVGHDADEAPLPEERAPARLPPPSSKPAVRRRARRSKKRPPMPAAATQDQASDRPAAKPKASRRKRR